MHIFILCALGERRVKSCAKRLNQVLGTKYTQGEPRFIWDSARDVDFSFFLQVTHQIP